MEHIKRNTRMTVITQVLTQSPNQIHTLGEFADMFDAAKSTISEDVTLIGEAMEKFGAGRIETVPGAAGGVIYRATLSVETVNQALTELSKKLSDGARALPGGYLYTSDLSSDPMTASVVGRIFATMFLPDAPDVVLTMETKGIPIAVMTARQLSVPLVIARRDSRAYEGSAVKINYVAGRSGERVETMTLERRAIKAGQRVLIVDDFAKNGGTLNGMADLAGEFGAEVAGVGVMIAARELTIRRARDVRPLIFAREVDYAAGAVKAEPVFMRKD